jgi:hypothetical protein
MLTDLLKVRRQINAIRATAKPAYYAASMEDKARLLTLPGMREQRNQDGDLTGHLELVQSDGYGEWRITVYISRWLPPGNMYQLPSRPVREEGA